MSGTSVAAIPAPSLSERFLHLRILHLRTASCGRSNPFTKSQLPIFNMPAAGQAGRTIRLHSRPMKRQRSKPHSFEDRLAAERKRLEEKAALLRDGHERKALLGKIAQIDTA